MRLFSIEVVFIARNFQIWFVSLAYVQIRGRSDRWLPRYSTLNVLRSSSIRGHLHLQQYSLLVWSPRPKFKSWWGEKWLLRYSTFNILSTSSIGGCLHCKQPSILIWSLLYKFSIWERSDQWLLRYSTLNILKWSSTVGHLHLQQFSILVWSPRL